MAHNHSTREEARVSGVQGYPQLQSRFKVSLGYEILSQNTKKKWGGQQINRYVDEQMRREEENSQVEKGGKISGEPSVL